MTHAAAHAQAIALAVQRYTAAENDRGLHNAGADDRVAHSEASLSAARQLHRLVNDGSRPVDDDDLLDWADGIAAAYEAVDQAARDLAAVDADEGADDWLGDQVARRRARELATAECVRAADVVREIVTVGLAHAEAAE